MPNNGNIQAVEMIKNTLLERKNFIILSYSGITVNELSSLRNDLRNDGVLLKVVKNNLFGLALGEQGYDESIREHLTGPNIIAFSESDLSGPAKLLKKFIKGKGKESPLEIKLGVADGVVYNKSEVEAIASLPSKEELIAKLMGSLNSPASGIAGVVNAVMAQLARAIQEVAKKNNAEA